MRSGTEQWEAHVKAHPAPKIDETTLAGLSDLVDLALDLGLLVPAGLTVSQLEELVDGLEPDDARQPLTAVASFAFTLPDSDDR